MVSPDVVDAIPIVDRPPGRAPIGFFVNVNDSLHVTGFPLSVLATAYEAGRLDDLLTPIRSNRKNRQLSAFNDDALAHA